MAAYQTLDDLPDLTAGQMASAGVLRFTPYTPANTGVVWDNSALVSGSEKAALAHDTYRFTAREGATYFFNSSSYADPTSLRIADKSGNIIVANSEADDLAPTRLSDGGFYQNDTILDWKAPYSGDFYVSASWSQDPQYTFYTLQVHEDVGTAVPAPIPVPAPGTAPTSIPEPTAATANIIAGTPSADELSGTPRADAIKGGNGADTIVGHAGNDFITGGQGDDILDGGAGIDTAIFSGTAYTYAVTVDPVTGAITVENNSAGNDGKDITQGFEFYKFSDKTLSTAELIAVKAPKSHAGTDGNDTLTGTSAADSISTGKGTDTVNAGDGNDFIAVGKGKNTVDGGRGIDTVLREGTTIFNVSRGADGSIHIDNAINNDVYTNVERFKAGKQYIAFDLAPGEAGRSAMQLAYTLKGTAGLSDGNLIANTFLPLLDKGFSLTEISSYLIDSGYVAALAGGSSNAHLVSTLFRAVTGTAADSATVAAFEPLITSGAFTQASLIAGVAQLELVGSSINFSQYASGGLVLAL